MAKRIKDFKLNKAAISDRPCMVCGRPLGSKLHVLMRWERYHLECFKHSPKFEAARKIMKPYLDKLEKRTAT